MTAIPDVTPAAGVISRVPRTLWVLASPRETFAELAEEGAKPARGYALMFLWLLIELVLGAPGVAASIAVEMGHEPLHGLTHLLGTYRDYVALPAVGMFVVGLSVFFVLRARKARRDLWTCVSIVGYAWVPHLVLLAVGALLTTFDIAHPFPAPHLRGHQVLSTARDILPFAIEVVPVGLWVYFATRALLRNEPAQPITPNERSRTWVVTLLFAALMVTSATGATRTVRTRWESFRPIEVGDSTPSLALLDINGKPVDSPTFMGKVSIIDFWATWCGPCAVSLPMLERVSGELEGVQLISLNTEPDNLAEVRKFRDDKALRAPVYVDTGSAHEKFHVSVLPTTLIIDKHGVLRHRHIGLIPEEQLTKELQALLAE